MEGKYEEFRYTNIKIYKSASNYEFSSFLPSQREIEQTEVAKTNTLKPDIRLKLSRA